MFLSRYNNSNYYPGPFLKRVVWYMVSVVVFESSFFPFSPIKCFLLRLFGAAIGKNVNLKPGIKIKYPWFLSIGDHTWIGENAWIDNLTQVTIGQNCCLSQGTYLCTGSHDWNKDSFDLITKAITICDHAWIGAQAIVAPGVTVNEGAVLSLSGTATKDLTEWTVYQGVPAVAVKKRNTSSISNSY